MKLGIVGFGFVGQALYMSINDTQGVEIYDTYKMLGGIVDIIDCDVVFTCLPTPQAKNGSQDFTEYKKFFEELNEHYFSGIIVVKSTVLYEHIEPYLEDYNIVFNPEFLYQNTAVEDFKKQRVVILGGRADCTRMVQKVYEEMFELDNNPDYDHCTIKEAIDIKYMHNIYHAYKVLFWNYVQGETSNARKMYNLYTKITDRNEMARISPDGKPGYGGACFPKDVAAKHSVQPHELTKYMIDYNSKIRNDGKRVFE